MFRILIALAACVFTLDAEPILTHRPLDSLAGADALIVGRVTSVEKGAEVFPPNDRTWQHRVFEHLAEVEILRFHAAGRELREQLEAQSRVRIAYRAENPLDQGGVFGGPLWPAIRVGEVRVFSVRNGQEGFRPWFDEGMGAVPPAQDTLLLDPPVPDGVAFLERELVNGLASGDAATAFKAARYADAAFLGWHDAAKNRRPAPERRRPAREAPANGMILTAFHWLLIHALELLPEENADSLIIQTLLDDLTAFHWGAVVNE
jgi:hypothetical protein